MSMDVLLIAILVEPRYKHKLLKDEEKTQGARKVLKDAMMKFEIVDSGGYLQRKISNISGNNVRIIR